VPETVPCSSVAEPSHVKRQCQTLRETPELQLARELVKLSYPVTLPISYSPPDLPTPKGKMAVVAVQVQKQSSTKAFVWVKFYPLLHTSVRRFSVISKAWSPKMDPLKGGISVSYPLSSYLTLEPSPGKIWA
jgi:hypothetical protein